MRPMSSVSLAPASDDEVVMIKVRKKRWYHIAMICVRTKKKVVMGKEKSKE